MNPFLKAKAMFAVAVALAVASMGAKPAQSAGARGEYTGPFRPPTRSGSRKVAWDKRAARKRNNVLRHRAACA